MVEISNTQLIIIGVALVLIVLLSFVIMFVGLRARPKAVKVVEPVVEKKEVVLPVAQKTLAKKKQDVEDYSDAKGFDSLTGNKSKFSARYWKDWWYNRQHPATTVLVSMELLNGFHKLFLVKEKEDGFKYRGKKYLFDNEAKYYVIDSKLWAYDFHETFSLPIKRVIPVGEIRKTIEQSGVSEVEYATNPATLERVLVAKIAEGIARGAALDAVFKFLKLMTIIILVVVVIHLVLFAQKSGLLDQVAIPGVTA